MKIVLSVKKLRDKIGILPFGKEICQGADYSIVQKEKEDCSHEIS